IYAVDSNTVWAFPLSPHPDVLRSSEEVRHYYFSNRHVRRRVIPFLGGTSAGGWEVIAPVEGANSWVRVAPRYRWTTNLIITVFTPRRLLYEQDLIMRDSPSTNRLHFADGSRVITYQSENDRFAYNVLENNLKIDREK